MSSVGYHEAAEQELLQEVAYLELRQAGLGRRFLEEVRRVEKRIAQYPQSGNELRPGIRKWLLHKFRYSLIYSLESEGPLVLAVAPHSRRPGYWVGRLRGP